MQQEEKLKPLTVPESSLPNISNSSPSQNKIPPLRILIVDDQPTICKNIEKQLKISFQNIDSTLLYSAESAIERCKNGDTFDIATMDIHMYGVDGYAATKTLCDEIPGISVFLHSSDPYEEKKVEACGAKAFVSKYEEHSIKKLAETIRPFVAPCYYHASKQKTYSESLPISARSSSYADSARALSIASTTLSPGSSIPLTPSFAPTPSAFSDTGGTTSLPSSPIATIRLTTPHNSTRPIIGTNHPIYAQQPNPNPPQAPSNAFGTSTTTQTKKKVCGCF